MGSEMCIRDRWRGSRLGWSMLYTCLLLLLQYVCEFADVALEELQLLFCGLPRGDDFHDGLKFRILPRSLGQHVDNRVWRRRLRRRGCLLRLWFGLWWAWLRWRLVLGWCVVVLIRALLVMIRPLSICRRLLMHLSDNLARSI